MNNKAKEMMIFKKSVEFVDDGVTHGMLAKFEPGTRVLKKGFQLAPKFKPLECDIILEKDIPVKMRDGVTIYTDILRPVTDEKVPGIIAWSPYGKSSGNAPRYSGIFSLVGIADSTVSGLQKFEGPDPAWWCKEGYAICHPDPRGIVHSEGDVVMLGSQEGEDCYDYIEWLAEQEWCNGKLALSGTSYLAISQWFIAAQRPPHLACINPTEGLMDAYRDWCKRGGIPDPAFMKMLSDVNHVHSGDSHKREDIATETMVYPFADAPIWEDKVAHPEKIECPALVVASYTNTLHTNGTFRAWRNLGSKEKWLRIHDSQEWPDYYNEENQRERLKFFDHYLKGIDNGWEKTPPVRYTIQDLEGGDIEGIEADTFPPAGTTYEKLYLNGDTRILSNNPAPVDIPSQIPGQYRVPLMPLASFIFTAKEKTEMVGYPKLKLWLETKDTDDMDIFVLVQKLDKFGHELKQFNVPNHSARTYDVTDWGSTVLRYPGTGAILRLSMRHLDENLSTDVNPYYSFDRSEPLSPGEIVAAELPLDPIGLVLYPGESLRVIVSTQNITGSMMPTVKRYDPDNRGSLVIHAGGKYDSYLQIPVTRRTA